ncbi:MAG: X-Pro dipeptidyl-peptidase-like protein [Actinomycetia bacterium]|nr:X-Pro dipeptidyl-peptidase-like protein [Actinomycetes bacterium]
MTLTSRVLAAMLRIGPALETDVVVERDVAVSAPDGVSLLTDVYLAASRRPLPVILVRSPYGRSGPSGVTGRLFAERGYHAVVQSTRGTSGSGGKVDFDKEATDGRATADWIVEQAWCNGSIGTFGGSYLSFTQYALASTRPPQLKAMATGVWAAERRAPYYYGGSFALGRALSWPATVENQEEGGRGASLRGVLRARRALVPALAHLPLLDADTVAYGHPVAYYRDWISHDQPGDPYWAPTDFRPLLRDLGVPVTMAAGWYDLFLPSMLADYQELRAGGQEARLRIGAWHHSSQGLFRHSVQDALDWFGTHLLGRPAAPAVLGGPAARVRMEVTGGGWRDLDDWPPPASIQRWHLQPGGGLATAPPPEGEPDRYTYDPADPTPAVGGTSVSDGGPKDNHALEQRADVLSYTSEPLTAPLEITGPVTAELHAGSSLPHADFFARLCDVDARGRSVNVTDGIVRLTAATRAPQLARVELWPTAHRFAAGHRIRLQVSSGAHPRYARNLGSGEPLATGTTLQVAEQAVYHDPEGPSAVLLPATPRD